MLDISKIDQYLIDLEPLVDFFKEIKQKGYSYSTDKYEKIDEFQRLKDLLKNEDWPKAVNEVDVCNDENDKFDRAKIIIADLLDIKDLKDHKVLDFGCGEEHTCSVFKDLNAKLTVGYDIKLKKMPELENVIFTDDLNLVKKNGLYNLIFVYDVLNHVKNPQEVIDLLKSLKTPKGNIYLRLHPWTSKHATHLYKKKNLACLQLIFSDEELIRLGLKGDFTNNFSIEYYDNLLENNFKIIKRNAIDEQVSDFFKIQPLLSKRIIDNLGLKDGDIFPNLNTQFVDYIVN